MKGVATGRPVIYVKSKHPRRGQSMKPFQLEQWARIREQSTANFSSIEDVNRAIRRHERFAKAHPTMQPKKFPRHIRERYEQAIAVKKGMKKLADQIQETGQTA
jgi:ubiquinone biosynthesis protein Coq4